MKKFYNSSLLIMILWTITVLVLSLSPRETFDPLQIPFWKKIYLDKVVHFAMYFILSNTWLNGLGNRKYKYLTTLLIVGIIGAGTEYLQGFKMIGRETDVADFVANLAGGAIGCLLYKRIRLKLNDKISFDKKKA